MDTTKIIGVRELQEQAAELIRLVREEGQTIEISDRGAVIARLVPVHPSPTAVQEDAAAWADLDRLSAAISARWPTDVSAVEAVRDVRREL